jgi:Phage tail assembly chaperone
VSLYANTILKLIQASTMIKLTPPAQINAAILLTVPGTPDPRPVEFVFKYHSAADLQKQLKTEGITDLDLLMNLLQAWPGVEAELTRENMTVFLSHYPAAAREIVAGYVKHLMESRVKN